MDILITFTPKQAYDNSISPVGKFRFKATYMPDANPNPLDSSIKIVELPKATDFLNDDQGIDNSSKNNSILNENDT